MKYKFLNSLVLLFFFSLPFSSLSEDSLKIAIDNPLRGNENINRDKYRNPYDTLSFFEISKEKKVLEVIPGTGWYTEIISKYMKGSQNFYVLMYDKPKLDILKKIQKKVQGRNQKVVEDVSILTKIHVILWVLSLLLLLTPEKLLQKLKKLKNRLLEKFKS